MRPQIVLFGDSITQQSFRSGGWGASVADTYSRKVDVVLRGYGGYNTRWALFLLHHLFPPVYSMLGEQGLKAEKVAEDRGISCILGAKVYLLTKLLTNIPKLKENLVSEAPSPAAVTIFFGANDAALLEGTGKRQHVALEEYKENLRKMVQHIKNHSPKTLVVLITPPPIDLEGRQEYARSMYGDKASKVADRTNEVAGKYAEQCAALAKELGLPSINLWSKMQETNGWQRRFLSDGLHLTPEGNAVVFGELVKILDEAGFSALPYDFPQHSEIDEENPASSFSQERATA